MIRPEAAQMDRQTARYLVRWHVSPVHDGYITSSFVAGLSALERQGEINLRLEALHATDADIQPHVMVFEVVNLRSGQERRVAFEVFDRADRFDLATLNDVDVYFKRSFRSDALADLPSDVRDRVTPSGLTFGCHRAGSHWLMLKVALKSFAARRHGVGQFTALKSTLRLFEQGIEVVGLLDARAFEHDPSDMVQDRVVFQTRLWPPASAEGADRQAVNRERVALVTALRSAFGGGDVIGLLHSDYARKQAPQALLTRKVERQEYAAQLRTSLISVNSQGLDGSGGFKIGESLAAGSALVSQPFAFELPEPLLAGVNFLPYRTPDECVEQCRQLLEDHSLSRQMREQNLAYYARNIRPDSFARNLLQRSFDVDA